MKPNPVRLYDFPLSGNGYKVRLALAHLGLRVDYPIVDLLAGECSSEDFLEKNPMGQIPCWNSRTAPDCGSRMRFCTGWPMVPT